MLFGSLNGIFKICLSLVYLASHKISYFVSAMKIPPRTQRGRPESSNQRRELIGFRARRFLTPQNETEKSRRHNIIQ
jgi:hypothetical protein